jgi:Na+-driven multidrug efflux pump
MVMIQVFNGTGDTKTPTYINFISFLAIPITLGLFYGNFPAVGHFWCITCHRFIRNFTYLTKRLFFSPREMETNSGINKQLFSRDDRLFFF